MKDKLIFIFVLSRFLLFGNNISVENTIITDNNPTQGYAMVQFDLSWENSWRVNSDPNNWDAAWLFIKFRLSNGLWHHAFLNNSNHYHGSGTSNVIEVGLLDDNLSFNSIANPGIGAMIYRSDVGVGNFNSSGIQVRWNYGSNGLSDLSSVTDIKVFAIEMVLVRGGNFWLGDGLSYGSFREVPVNSPCLISDQGLVIKSDGTFTDDENLEGDGIWVDGDLGISLNSASASNLNTEYPTGYRGFYCMKYEVSQGQYKDFLNTLDRVQQNKRTAVDISVESIFRRYVMCNRPFVDFRNCIRCDEILPPSGPIEFYCDFDEDGVRNEENDGEWIACNYLDWGDGLSFLDWSGLRPMTELEFEKSCRGPLEPVTAEYAWGTSSIKYGQYSISDLGTSLEGISFNYSISEGNSLYQFTNSINGPTRVGIMASNTLNFSRMTSGASYYGAMELSGNLMEPVVTIGNIHGRNYTGKHGDGSLDALGNFDVPLWPSINGLGGGFKGGGWGSGPSELRVSDRYEASLTNVSRYSGYGFRGVRGVSPSGSGF